MSNDSLDGRNTTATSKSNLSKCGVSVILTNSQPKDTEFNAIGKHHCESIIFYKVIPCNFHVSSISRVYQRL